MSVKQRIREFIKVKGMGQREFCRAIGVSEAYVSNMRSSIQPDKLLRIAHKFPELNTEWLITGEGEMLRAGYTLHPEIREDFISSGSEVFKDKLIDMFKKGEIYPAALVWEQHRLIMEKSARVEELLKEVEALKLRLAKHEHEV